MAHRTEPLANRRCIRGGELAVFPQAVIPQVVDLFSSDSQAFLTRILLYTGTLRLVVILLLW